MGNVCILAPSHLFNQAALNETMEAVAEWRRIIEEACWRSMC